MHEGVVDAGRARARVNLPVQLRARPATTNDCRKTSGSLVLQQHRAGLLYRFEQYPRSLGRGAIGAGMCGSWISAFMSEAIKKYGGGPFECRPGGAFTN